MAIDLNDFELFAELSPAEFEVIVSAGRARRFSPGERIFTEGDPVDHVTMLLSGLAKRTQDEVILDLQGAGEILGSLGTNQKRKQLSGAQAVLPSVALVWNAGVFQELLVEIPTLRRNIVRALEKHLSEKEQRYQEVRLARRVDSRLRSMRLRSILVRIANELHRSTESPLEIPLSRNELAQLTGTTLFAVSRLLCLWQAQGIVSVRREVVQVHDLLALTKLL